MTANIELIGLLQIWEGKTTRNALNLLDELLTYVYIVFLSRHKVLT